MEITKEKLEALKEDPFARFMSSICGIDLDKIVDEELKKQVESKTTDKNASNTKELKEKINKLVEEGRINPLNSNIEKKFIMSASGLKNFIKEYQELENTFSKLKYAYGIDLNCGGNTGTTIYNTVNEIIWKLIRIIFGDDNADIIADYCFGNSEFESVEELYKELS